MPVVARYFDAYGLSDCPGDLQTLDTNTFEVGGLSPGPTRLVEALQALRPRKIVGAAVLKDQDLKSTTPLEVKLVPSGAITGRLLDDDGLPWAGAKIHVSMLNLDRQILRQDARAGASGLQ